MKRIDRKQIRSVGGGGLLDRRAFIRSGATFLASATAISTVPRALGHDFSQFPSSNKLPGTMSEAYGLPATYEKGVKRKIEQFYNSGLFTGALTPLDQINGIITPSGLHFSIHHNGIPDIDPAIHEVMVHGLVDKALKWNIETLLNYPMVSRVRFLECSGNSAALAVSDTPAQGNCQTLHGQVSCSEWTGVPLRYLLDEAGVKPGAEWVMCEGGDSGSHVRNIPLTKLYDDGILAFYQNGERVRPDQGYPCRLFLPGYEGNANVKWLRRMEVTDQPSQSKDEQSLYAEFTSDDHLRQFTMTMEVKSLITRPSGDHQLPDNGYYEISGLAWSGRGKIVKVEVSADSGKSWVPAHLEGPAMDKCFTRFTMPWSWQGREAVLLSRATDEHGNVQPTRSQWKSRFAEFTFNHYNAINAWHVSSQGVVSNVYI